MIFDIQYKEPVVHDGYAMAELILLSNDFLERVSDVVRFTYTNDSSATVAANFAAHQELFMQGAWSVIPVKGYYYKKSYVIATTFPGDRAIYVNRNGVHSRRPHAFIENGIHEFAHVPLGYSHGTNFPPGSWRGRLLGDREDKTMSVPHLFARIGVQLAKEKGMIR